MVVSFHCVLKCFSQVMYFYNLHVDYKSFSSFSLRASLPPSLPPSFLPPSLLPPSLPPPQIFDRLLASIGQDTLDTLYWSAVERKGRKREHVETLFYFIVANIYVRILREFVALYRSLHSQRVPTDCGLSLFINCDPYPLHSQSFFSCGPSPFV